MNAAYQGLPHTKFAVVATGRRSVTVREQIALTVSSTRLRSCAPDFRHNEEFAIPLTSLEVLGCL